MLMDERIARSVALENAYVYDVYEQFYDNPQSKPWPKVKSFLESLEPGSIICDVGCGNGKYLNVNSTIFNIGGDKSTRLTTVAREENNEVIILDNLSLPFRDNSLDAVVSIAVVHHLATTERRINAIRELARVLRIGGRIIISVWAMEQTHRKFESQDVLVPWKRPRNPPPSLELTTSATSTSEDDGLIPYSAYTQTSDTESSKSLKSKLSLRTRRNRKTSQTKQRHSSPSSSSLSSPNETCYSFVRKAIQRLAGSRRVSVHKPWFLESWNVAVKREYQDENETCACSDCIENVQDIPIELRRIDNDENLSILVGQRRKTFPTSQLVNDLPPPGGGYVANKSRSLTNIKTIENNNNNDDSPVENTPIEKNIEEPNEKEDVENVKRLVKPKLVKQKKSICEEDADEALDQPTDIPKTPSSFFLKTLTSSRRGSVFKQRSLNEELMSDRVEEKQRVRQNIQKQVSLNEELIYHGNSFESFRDSTSKKFQLIKTGFTKIKNSNIEYKVTGQSLRNGFARMFQNWKSAEGSPSPKEFKGEEIVAVNNNNNTPKEIERKSSKEDGSDSSKDSSLQSDTSVDSEDSFASVIFVPKSNPMSPTPPLSSDPTSPKLKTTPTSPKLRQSSCPTSPRIKQMPLTIYPLMKQLSSPKRTTPNITGKSLLENELTTTNTTSTTLKIKKFPANIGKSLSQKYSVVQIPEFKKNNVEDNEKKTTSCLSRNNTPGKEENCTERNERLKKIRDMLTQSPGFGMKNNDNSKFPLIRHSSVANGKVSAEPLPKLVTLELFNPETDDKDSDSSTVSSPDSVDSIVSVKSDRKNQKIPEESRFKFPTYKNTKQSKLLEAAVEVASSLDEAVTKVIKTSPKLSERQVHSNEVMSVIKRSYSFETTPLVGNEETLDEPNSSIHLNDFTNELSVKLLKEITEYQEKTKQSLDNTWLDNLNDTYINRLSNELDDLTKISAEIRKQNEYLTKLSSGSGSAKIECDCEKIRTNDDKTKLSNNFNNSLEKTTSNTSSDSDNNQVFKLTRKKRLGNSTDSCDSEKGSSTTSMVSSMVSSINTIDSEKNNEFSLLSSSFEGSTASLVSAAEIPKCGNKMKTSYYSNSVMSTSSLDSLNRNKRLLLEEESGGTTTSQESLISDNTGGEITYHRYYHVFKEGELDQLIEKYVDNLHIISSYYDHASWCIVAEKVQVWTI